MSKIVWPMAAVMLVQAMLMVATVTVPILAPELALDTGIEPRWIGVYSSLVFSGALISIVLGGHLTRRFGAVTMSQIALVISGLALMATASGTLPIITGSAIAAGFGYGLATPAASQILAKISQPKRRGVVFSLKQSTVSLGGLIAGLIVPALVIGFGWKTATFCLGLTVLTACILIHPLRRSQDEKQPTQLTTLNAPWHSIRYVLHHPRLRVLALTALTFAAAQNSTNAIFVTFVVETMGMPLVLAGLAFSTMQVAGMTTRVFLGWISDQFISATRLMGVVGLLIAMVLSILPFMNASWPAILIYLFSGLIGAFVMGWSGVYLAEIARIVRHEDVATATSGTVFFSFLGAALGPTLFSLILSGTGNYTSAFITIAAISGSVGLLILAIQDRPKSQ